ncbi:mechanosensitive ion channel domain-containing protein [Microbacterium sp. CJ88]|uniref:mechanosensitive ion channel domain-containing protein n=1 Tax=Microbacterium sp. CJ88 TaxID=3445672 RepID=UPI003F65C945
MNLFDSGWLWWAIGIAVAVPVLLVVLTELLGFLSRRGNPAAGPVRLLRNWVLPVGALFALLAFAFQTDIENPWPRVVATVLGFLVILLILSAFNVALFANARDGSWRERIPSIFVEIVRLLLVVIGLAFLFQWVWGADIGGLIATLGVTSIVIGLALQNAVGGVISGLLLLFEQPFKIGDYLEVGGVSGRVVEVNWRACHIDTGSGIQIVPNSTLSGASFTNRSQPLGPFHVTTTVKFTTDDPPHEVVQLLVEVADSLPMRFEGERASAEYSGAGAYSVSLPIAGPAMGQRALSLYLAWLWYAARRRGLALDGDATDPIAEPGRLEKALEVVGPTLHLGDEERELVLATGKLERYGLGEIVQAQGILPHEVRFIVDGHVRLAVEAAGGRVEFATAEPGDYVGQTALTREKTLTEAIAADVLTVLVLPLETVDALVKARPLLAAEIGQSIELKRKLAAEALAGAGVVRGTLRG